MNGDYKRLLGLLGRWSPSLFLLAGVLLVGYAALNGVAAFTGEAYVMVEDVVGPAGFVLGFLGLLGLYPELSYQTPAKLGAVCVSIGVVGFSVITMMGFAVLAGMEIGGVPVLLVLLVAVGMIPGYVSFAIASHSSKTYGETLGILLLLPAVVFTAMLSQPFVYSQLGLFRETTMAWSNFGISSGQAVAHLAIGYTLRTSVSRTRHETFYTDRILN
jgi:hypothetical protein